MSAAPIFALAVFAAIWPFGRDKGAAEPTTIGELEPGVVEIDVDTPIPASEDKAIESYRRFLELAADDPLLRAEAMRRLADLEVETAEGWGDAAALEDSVERYTELLEAYPDYEKRDLVLYQLARAYEARGELDRALEALDRLVTEYPHTLHYEEAQFRRGEALFVDGRYDEAEHAYASVLARGEEGQFYVQALYKHGWSVFKQDRYKEALDSFFALLDIELGRSPTVEVSERFAAMGRAEQELVDDTLRVTSIGFSYEDGAASATNALRKLGPRPYAYVVFLKLGELYVEQERWQDADDAYRAFVELDPWHERAPLLAVEALAALEKGGFADLVLEGKRDFVERYGFDSAFWERHARDAQPSVVAHLQANLADLARHHHAAAQSTNSPGEYMLAAHWYRTYLSSFPDGDDVAATHFLLAEVLFESGAYGEAAEEYERTAYEYPYHERSEDAGYAALLAYHRQEETLEGAERAAWHRRSIESALHFASAYPDHEHAPAVETDAAERLFALGDLAAARNAALRVAGREAPVAAELERTAWTVIAHAEFESEHYADAERAYRHLAALVPPGDPGRGELAERIASSIYKQGEEAQARGDERAAIEHFLRVGTAAPSSPIRAIAEYDAAAALMRIEDWTRAAAVLEDFRRRFPDHELARDIGANLAVTYLESGEPVRAAAELEGLANGEGPSDERREALWRAAELYAEGGDPGRAAAAYARYIDRHPSPVPAAIEARQRLVELAASRGDEADQRRWLAAIVSADAAAGAERTERTRLLAARAQLALAAPLRDAFSAVRLVAPLERNLAVKQERMERALEAYGKAADYGLLEITTAATYEIAELYHALGRALLESERPAGLTAVELEQYDILLEEQAFPFEEQAIDVHEVNAARTAEGVYDEWVKRSLAALAELMPARYAKTEIGEQLVSAIR